MKAKFETFNSIEGEELMMRSSQDFLTLLGPDRVIGIIQNVNTITIWYWHGPSHEEKLQNDINYASRIRNSLHQEL